MRQLMSHLVKIYIVRKEVDLVWRAEMVYGESRNISSSFLQENLGDF